MIINKAITFQTDEEAEKKQILYYFGELKNIASFQFIEVICCIEIKYVLKLICIKKKRGNSNE